MDEDKKNTQDEVLEDELDQEQNVTPEGNESDEDDSEDVEEDQSDDAADVAADDQEDDEEDSEPPVSRREAKRIQQLLERLKEKDQDPDLSQKEKREEKRQIIEEGDYDLDQINEIASKYGSDEYNRGLKTAEDIRNATLFQTRLEIDAPKITSRYEFMNPSSDDFDAGRTEFINTAYLRMVGYDNKTGTVKNADIRYEEFVEGIMELVDVQAEVKSANTAKNVASQVAKSGVRPGGVAKKAYQGSDPTKMTDKQLDEIISQSLGSFRR